jgi:preprotein translocase subunit SecA
MSAGARTIGAADAPMRAPGMREPRPTPGVRWDAYPMRSAAQRRDALHALAATLRRLDGRCGARFAAVVKARADALEREPHALAHLAQRLSSRIGTRRAPRGWRRDALALATLAARTALGQDPWPSQLRAAATMLDGGLAELATGEGKTLALALAAAARALAGVPVHVIGVNDYLVERDAAALDGMYRALGLSCDRVLHSDDRPRRREAHRADVVYTTAREAMFDHLRDRLAGHDRAGLAGRAARLGHLAASAHALAGAAVDGPVLRGLCCALVDEADALLIDEAAVPCVLSQAAGDDDSTARDRALSMAGRLREHEHFELDAAGRRAVLTRAGAARVAAGDIDADARGGSGAERAAPGAPPRQAATPGDGDWRFVRARRALVERALAVLHLYRRDRDYLVRDGRVEIVDPHTGRVAPGRAWSEGVHQMIEAREGVGRTAPHATAIEVTAQQFFGRYWLLGGLSATLRESRKEFALTYGLAVHRIPPRHRSRLADLGRTCVPDRDAVRTAVVERARRHAGAGRPVLVGTRDVAESEALAAAMRAAGLAPAVLNARHDRHEAAIVAQAGRAGRVTIATSMAGRGTDIVLDPAALAAGGLALIATCAQPSRRLDRQLAGRAGRRGEPGTVETIVALDAPVAGPAGGPLPAWLARAAARLPAGLATPMVGWAVRRLQSAGETRERVTRRRLLAQVRERERSALIGRSDD